MKFKAFYLYAVLSLGVIVVSGWFLWSGTATAQAPALAPLTPPPPSQSTIVQYGQYAPSLGPPIGMYSGYVTEADPETAKLVAAYQAKQREIGELLARRGEEKDDSDLNELRKQLSKVTAAQFDLQQQQRTRQIEQLNKRLADAEKNVKERNELKDEIVKKRVADLLREPDQLQWETPNPALAPNGLEVFPAPIGITAPPNVATSYQRVFASHPTDPNYVTKTITRIESRVTVDEHGNQKVVQTPIHEVVLVDADGVPYPRPVPTATTYGPSSRGANSSDVANAAVQGALAPRVLSIPETEAWLERERNKSGDVTLQMQAAEAWLKAFKTGVATPEMQTAEAQLELAKLSLDQSRAAEYASRLKFLELDVQQAQSVLEQALVVLVEATESNQRAPNSIPEKQVAARRAAVEQSRIELERARKNLELHQKSNVPQAESPESQP